MKRSALYILAAVILATAGCTYPFDAEIEGVEDMMIVEGSITIGSYSNISLGRITSLKGEENTTPFDCEVSLECEGGESTAAVGSNPYQLDTRSLDPSRRYRLVIKDNKTSSVYLTEWTDVLGAPEVDDLGYGYDDNGLLCVKISLHSEHTPYFSISYDERWEYNSWVQTKYLFSRNTKEITIGTYPYYTCWNQTDFTKSTTLSAEAYVGNKLTEFPVVRFSRGDSKISVLYNILMKVSLIPEESYRYWQNLDKISQPDGDLFTPIPSSMRGNIYKEGSPKETVLGYVSFAASKPLSLYIKNEDTDYYVYPTDKVNYMLRDQHQSLLDPDQWVSLYNQGYWPYDVIIEPVGEEGKIVGYKWLNIDCLDCRRQGGTNKKPEDWGL